MFGETGLTFEPAPGAMLFMSPAAGEELHGGEADLTTEGAAAHNAEILHMFSASPMAHQAASTLAQTVEAQLAASRASGGAASPYFQGSFDHEPAYVYLTSFIQKGTGYSKEPVTRRGCVIEEDGDTLRIRLECGTITLVNKSEVEHTPPANYVETTPLAVGSRVAWAPLAESKAYGPSGAVKASPTATGTVVAMAMPRGTGGADGPVFVVQKDVSVGASDGRVLVRGKDITNLKGDVALDADEFNALNDLFLDRRVGATRPDSAMAMWGTIVAVDTCGRLEVAFEDGGMWRRALPGDVHFRACTSDAGTHTSVVSGSEAQLFLAIGTSPLTVLAANLQTDTVLDLKRRLGCGLDRALTCERDMRPLLDLGATLCQAGLCPHDVLVLEEPAAATSKTVTYFVRMPPATLPHQQGIVSVTLRSDARVSQLVKASIAQVTDKKPRDVVVPAAAEVTFAFGGGKCSLPLDTRLSGFKLDPSTVLELTLGGPRGGANIPAYVAPGAGLNDGVAPGPQQQAAPGAVPEQLADGSWRWRQRGVRERAVLPDRVDGGDERAEAAHQRRDALALRDHVTTPSSVH